MTEFFCLFPDVFFSMAMICVLLICIYIYFFSGFGSRKNLKPVCYISYNKNYFQKEFEFTCEFCGSTVSSKDEKCPKCAGDFGKNKEYQSKKRAMNQRYVRYLKDQEEALEKEMEYISNTMETIRRYKLVRHKAYNFEIGEPPIYKPAIDYEFDCEYCGNKLRGKSTDEKGCMYCGASYEANLELSVREEEDRLEKRHYDQYMELKDLESRQNIRNEQRDAGVDEKYGTAIKFMEKKGKYIALVMVCGVMLISAGITLLILKFR